MHYGEGYWMMLHEEKFFSNSPTPLVAASHQCIPEQNLHINLSKVHLLLKASQFARNWSDLFLQKKEIPKKGRHPGNCLAWRSKNQSIVYTDAGNMNQRARPQASASWDTNKCPQTYSRTLPPTIMEVENEWAFSWLFMIDFLRAWPWSHFRLPWLCQEVHIPTHIAP